jgi:hypothetical protein
MTVLRSASGARIDCDECAHHVVAPTLSIEALRFATGYVSDRGRDFCPSCWYERAASRFGMSSSSPTDDGPSAA